MLKTKGKFGKDLYGKKYKSFFFKKNKACNGTITTKFFTRAMGDGLPVKRVSVDTVHFGHTVCLGKMSRSDVQSKAHLHVLNRL